MGGRGSAGGIGVAKNNVRTVHGLSVGSRLFAKESDVAKLSQNTVWIENTSTPHAVLKNSQGVVQVRGSKKDKYGILENVNTAVVHLSGVERSTPVREVAKLNKQLGEIRSRGFDVQRISVGEYESVVYIKRKLFTKAFFPLWVIFYGSVPAECDWNVIRIEPHYNKIVKRRINNGR